MSEIETKQAFESAGIAVDIQKDPKHWKLRYGKTVIGYWPTTGSCWAFGKSFRPEREKLVQALLSGRIRMPAEADRAVCTSCGADIWWVVTAKGKKMPLDGNGEAHWSSCPNASAHRKGVA